MTVPYLILRLTSILLVGAVATAQVDWRQVVPPSMPPYRMAHRLTFDSLRGRVIMYGGGGRLSTPYYETWAWNGSRWTQLQTQNAPDGFVMPGITYDRQRDRVVVYGGHRSDGLPSTNTWEFDGVEWHQMSPSHVPPWHARPMIAYHAGIQRVVLFGGITTDDTRLWDGTDWTQVTTPVHPVAREGHGFVYDEARDVIVLFGGRNIGATPLDDTWEFDGTSWARIWPAHSPSPRAFHWMAYDSDRQRVVLYRGDVNHNRVWEYDGVDWAWRQLSMYPVQVVSQDMVYDGARRRIVMFGYTGPPWLSQTWELITLSAADVQQIGVGCAQPRASLARAPHEWPWIDDVFEQEVVGSASSRTAFFLLGVSRTTFGGASLPLPLDAAGAPGCALLVSADWVGGYVLQNGTATISLMIPNDRQLLGVRLYEQVLVHDPSLPGGWTASDGYSITFGSR